MKSFPARIGIARDDDAQDAALPHEPRPLGETRLISNSDEIALRDAELSVLAGFGQGFGLNARPHRADECPARDRPAELICRDVRRVEPDAVAHPPNHSRTPR